MAGSLMKIRCLAVGVLLISLAGCGTSTGTFNVVVKMDDAWGSRSALPSVEVHLVGVNNSEYAAMSTEKMTKYWKETSGAADTKRRRVMKFGQSLPPEQTLPKSDAIWQEWKKNNCRYLFVLADIPEVRPDQDKDGDADARRLILPLEVQAWRKAKYVPMSGPSTIIISISKPPVGVYCVNAPETRVE